MKSETWCLLVADGGEVCDTCKKIIPADVLILSNKHTRQHVFICYSADCIIKHPRNCNQDCIKIDDTQARIMMHKTRIVRLYGLDYWNRNKMIPIGYEEFESKI